MVNLAAVRGLADWELFVFVFSFWAVALVFLPFFHTEAGEIGNVIHWPSKLGCLVSLGGLTWLVMVGVYAFFVIVLR